MTVCQEKRHHFSDFMGLGMGASGRLGEVGGGGEGGGGRRWIPNPILKTNDGLCWDAVEPSCCKHCMVTVAVNLNSLRPFSMTLTFIQGHSGMNLWRVL